MSRHKLTEKLFQNTQTRNIINYLEKIKQIFPILKQNYNIDMYDKAPVTQRPTAVTYTGTDSKNRILLEFNSNYNENR